MTPQVAVDPQGDAIVVWDRYDGSHSIVQASRLKAGSPVWEVPINLSAAGEDATGEQVGLDSQGDAIAVWTRRDASGNAIVQASVRPASAGSWKLPATNLSALASGGETARVETPAGPVLLVMFFAPVIDDGCSPYRYRTVGIGSR
jgi:hypothetical protein